MQDKDYATAALKDILIRALAAVALNTTGVDLVGWDLEFAQMAREEQADWLITLFEALIEHG